MSGDASLKHSSRTDGTNEEVQRRGGTPRRSISVKGGELFGDSTARGSVARHVAGCGDRPTPATSNVIALTGLFALVEHALVRQLGPR